ncbi:MAG TPA: FHIPEP family type III secretion protein [Sedimentisphaerales bacterium]|nr:FHIPEP family type III secretion protein [Sedimentisphaerales bacterium]
MRQEQDGRYNLQDCVCEARIVCRTDYLLLGGIVAVAAGLLFPLQGRIFDVLLIFSMSLTAAVLMITLSAQGAFQVQSFPLLVVLFTTLRIGLSVACAKLILLGGNAGTIVNFLGRLVAGGHLAFTICVFGVLVALIFMVVLRTVRGISLAGTEYASEIAPFRWLTIDNKLSAGAISDGQALSLRAEVVREASFFSAMRGASKFMLCGAGIELVIIIVNITASLAKGIAVTSSGETTSRAYGNLAVGSGIATQISVLITVLASGYLVRKSFLRPAAAGFGTSYSQPGRIRVTASEVLPPAKKEDEQADPPRRVEATSARSVEAWIWRDVEPASGYERIAELVKSRSSEKAKVLLMGAVFAEELPVTVPVNIAIRLAHGHQRCLLVDLDSERDALAKVFDDKSDSTARSAAGEKATCISNLWIWPASGFGKVNGGYDLLKLKNLITSVAGRYDHLIIYAPNIKPTVRWEQAASSIHLAMLFGKAGHDAADSPLGRLHRVLTDSGCDILRPAQVLVEGV